MDYLHTEKPYALDITDHKLKRDLVSPDSKLLAEHIYNEVKDTQRLIQRTLPNKIIMTKKQYDILTKTPEMIASDPFDSGQEFYLYRTPMNIMEVEISTKK